ncbi:hypothetical protein NHX12_025323, partial [Muraenolepis orangiensis]
MNPTLRTRRHVCFFNLEPRGSKRKDDTEGTKRPAGPLGQDTCPQGLLCFHEGTPAAEDTIGHLLALVQRPEALLARGNGSDPALRVGRPEPWRAPQDGSTLTLTESSNCTA